MVDARKPIGAGTFYPSAHDALATTVRQLLEGARPSRPTPGAAVLGEVRAIVVPHGPYVRAGAAIASGWAQVESAQAPKRRVLLIGPAHHVPLAGLAAPFADAFATPLGTVAIDRIAIEAARRFPQL